MQVATLAGGCFWCLEAVFSDVKGVISVQSGYAGGRVPFPTYEQVCTGKTNHAEVVQLTFDPNIISFQDILQIFFSIHDPTTLNRQGADVGTQYRSAIFYHNKEQERVARETIASLKESGVYPDIVTEVKEIDQFYPAEEYHKEYYKRNTQQPYCNLVIKPKLEKFRRQHQERLKS